MPFEICPEKLVYGGDALGHYEGRTVLVPRALPSERLEVEPVRTAKGVVRAHPLRIVAPAPERMAPPCPYFGHCGGCQYQHLSIEHQISAKREILRETLRRIGKITWDSEISIHAAHPWNYRNQAELKVASRPDGKVEMGFFEAESYRLFPIDVCLILSSRLNAMLGELRSAKWSKHLVECREIEILADDRDEQVMLTLRGHFNLDEAETLACDFLTQLPGVLTVAIDRGREMQVFGEGTLTYCVGEFRYQISPGSFFQASRFLLPELVGAVTEGQSGTMALDMFAGVGLFTLPLAKTFIKVVGVEANPKSARDLTENARTHDLTGIRAVGEAAFEFLRRFAQPEPDLVILDPPRAGVDLGSLKLLVALRPKRIHYVSCSPPTLARDLTYLTANGYQLNSIDLFDLFPQTFHIESLAKLTRNDRASL